MKSIRVVGSDTWAQPEDLRGLYKNPRRPLTATEQSKLDRSLEVLGLFRPLLVWHDPESGLTVIGGNQRIARIQELVRSGVTLVLQDGTPAPGVPVTVWTGSAEDARVVAMRDNNSDGDWDFAELAGQLEALSTDDLRELAGFDAELVRDLIDYGAGAEARLVNATTNDPPEPEPEPVPEAKKSEETSDQLVGCVIGHVRGRIRAETYRQLVEELAVDLDRDRGLDAAVVGLLARLRA